VIRINKQVLTFYLALTPTPKAKYLLEFFFICKFFLCKKLKAVSVKPYGLLFCRERGYKTVECTCKGAEKGFVSYHASSALSLHIGLARRQETA
jgi:hypothetical protein